MIRGVGLSELLPSINLRRDRSRMWLVGMSTEAEGNRAGIVAGRPTDSATAGASLVVCVLV